MNALLISICLIRSIYSESSDTDSQEGSYNKKIIHKLDKSQYISKKEFCERIYNVLPTDENGLLPWTFDNPEEHAVIFIEMLERIHTHYKGHRVKLAAFTSVLLNNYDYNFDYILNCDHFEACRSKRGALQFSRKDRMKILNRYYIDMSKFEFSDRKRAVDTLEAEFRFFSKAIKEDYSFASLIETFFPHFLNKMYRAEGEDLEYVYYKIIYKSIEETKEDLTFLQLEPTDTKNSKKRKNENN